ncbi:MAG: Mg/Co/Ni transporter MgtE, partial [Colwellia sp.]
MSNTFTKLVSQLTHSLEQENDQELLISIEKYHPAKLGRLLESLPNKYRDGFWSLIPVNSKGEVLLSV